MVFCFIRHVSSCLILQVAFVKPPFFNCRWYRLNRRWVVYCGPVLEIASLFKFSESKETSLATKRREGGDGKTKKDPPAIVDGASAGGEVCLEGPLACNLLEGER